MLQPFRVMLSSWTHFRLQVRRVWGAFRRC